MSSMAVDAAVVGAAYNSPTLARDMVQTATAGSIISATDAARTSMPVSGPADTSNPSYAAALVNTSVAAQENLMQLASQNQLLETLMQSL